MPRPNPDRREEIIDRALGRFWSAGYGASSIDNLIEATASSRRALYAEFGSKHGLFLACFPHYSRIVVDPAFERVERSGATLDDVDAYFDHQISLAEQAGLPGPGCFIANAATETAPHDPQVLRLVLDHNRRLTGGFAGALANQAGMQAGSAPISAIAASMTVFANGLWSASRVTSEAGELRRAVVTFAQLIRKGLDDATN
jgi:TetR/AcrR family transcriptional regulator, transcriptional repressor for nem operon